MPARQVYSSESLGRSTTSSSSAQTKATLSFTPDVNRPYLIFAQATVDIAAVNKQCVVELHEDATGARQSGKYEFRSISERGHWRGVWVIFASATPSLKNLFVRFRSTDNTTVVGIQDVRITALRLEAGDHVIAGSWVQSTAQNTWLDSSALTFTPATTDDYLVIAAANINTNNAPGYARGRLLLDGATAIGDSATMSQTGDYVDAQWSVAAKVNLTNASHTFKIQGLNTDPASPYFLYIDLPLICALKLSDFPGFEIQESRALSTTVSTSPQQKVAASRDMIFGVNYLVLTLAAIKTSSSTGFVGAVAQDNGVDMDAGAYRQALATPASAAWSHLFRARRMVPDGANAGSHTFSIKFRSDNAANTASIEHAIVAILKLDDQQALFGAGTGSIPSGLAFGTGSIGNQAGLVGVDSLVVEPTFGVGTTTQDGRLIGFSGLDSSPAFGTGGQLSAEQFLIGTNQGSIAGFDPSLGGSISEGLIGAASLVVAPTFGAGSATKIDLLQGAASLSVPPTFGAGAMTYAGALVGYAGMPSSLRFGTNIAQAQATLGPTARIRKVGKSRYLAVGLPNNGAWNEELEERVDYVERATSKELNTLDGFASIPSGIRFGSGALT